MHVSLATLYNVTSATIQRFRQLSFYSLRLRVKFWSMLTPAQLNNLMVISGLILLSPLKPSKINEKPITNVEQ